MRNRVGINSQSVEISPMPWPMYLIDL